MVNIFLRLRWKNVSISNVCNQHIETGKLLLTLTRNLRKECINEYVVDNTFLSHHAVICIEYSGKIGVVSGPYQQLCHGINHSFSHTKDNNKLGT